MYTSYLCFLNKNELPTYKENNENRIEIFSKAKLIQDYL